RGHPRISDPAAIAIVRRGRRRRAHTVSRTPALPKVSATARRRSGPSPAATCEASAAPAAPAATQPARGIPVIGSTNGDQRPKLLEGRRADELACLQIVDGSEWLLLPGGDDLCCGDRPDTGQRVELLGGGRVQVDRSAR